MKSVMLAALLATPLLVQPAIFPVRERSEPVCVALEKALKKGRADISAADLATVTDLKLPHIHIKSFKDHDFAGMTNLKKLQFFSLLHNDGEPNDPIAINNNVFAPLSNLEELVMHEDLGRLPDEVFAGLKSLKILEMPRSSMRRLPKSLLTLPKIEAVYFEGRGLNPEELAALKSALGDKLKGRRPK